MADDIILHASDVTIRFGGLTAVSDFNLAIRPHELLGLIGPNGAGKTTVFNMLTGVYKPTEGEIFVNGHPTGACKPYDITALGVARTFQNIRLFKERHACGGRLQPAGPSSSRFGAALSLRFGSTCHSSRRPSSPCGRVSISTMSMIE